MPCCAAGGPVGTPEAEVKSARRGLLLFVTAIGAAASVFQPSHRHKRSLARVIVNTQACE